MANITTLDILSQPFYKVGKLNISRKSALECVIAKPVLLSRILNFNKNESFLLKAISLNCLIIRYMDKSFKKQLKFMLKISQMKNTVEYCYKYASTDIQLNKKFKANLIDNDVDATLILYNFYIEPDIIELGLKKSHKVFTVLNINIQTSLTNNFSNAKKLMEINPLLYEFLPHDLKPRKELIKIALSKNPFVFTLFQNMLLLDKDVLKELLHINPFIIQYFSDKFKNNKELIMYALYKNGLVLEHISNATRIQTFTAIVSNNQVLSRLKKDTIINICKNAQFFINSYNSINLFLQGCSQIICLRNIDYPIQNTHKKLGYHGLYQGLKLKKEIVKYIVGDIQLFKKYYKLSVNTVHSINQYMLLKS